MMHQPMHGFENELLDEIEIKEPKRYSVFLLNDDYSSMEFVIKVLMQVFHHGLEKATEITLAVHEKGKGLCGVYTYEIAETKVATVRKMAKEERFPLRAIMESE
nr:ATP-dependent Clp protease adaptor ClpS [Sulfurospirillum barnesii]